ncbi:NUDIX domain-containing protein [Algoriphagus namhaensis]
MGKDKIRNKIEVKFGNHLRSRVNGVLIEEDKILMIQHQMSEDRIFWSTPGGGMVYGQSAIDNLKREFMEETNLEIEVVRYLFVHEFLKPPLHAMEHFFEVKRKSGHLKLGTDPELEEEGQILQELKWMSLDELHSLPNNALHQIFWRIKSLKEIGKWTGYFNFENISIK